MSDSEMLSGRVFEMQILRDWNLNKVMIVLELCPQERKPSIITKRPRIIPPTSNDIFPLLVEESGGGGHNPSLEIDKLRDFECKAGGRNCHLALVDGKKKCCLEVWLVKEAGLKSQGMS